MNKEKKKLVILIALAVMVVAVGAFQFRPPKQPPAVPPTNTPKPADTDVAASAPDAPKPTGPKNPEVANDLPARDPFAVPEDQQPKMAGFVPPVTTPGKLHNTGNHAIRPALFGSLPSAFSVGKGLAPGGPMAPIAVEPTFRLVGVIQGVQPLAMFEDVSGNQKLVALNGSLDGDTKLVQVEQSSVFISFRGQKRRLTISAGPGGPGLPAGGIGPQAGSR